MSSKSTLKKLLEDLPFSADIYWQLRGQYKQWSAHYKLEGLRAVLPEAVREVQAYALPNPAPKKIAIFASLHYWIEQAGLIALALAGQGHQVELAYLPYAEWEKPISRFDLRRQDLYTQKVFAPASPILKLTPLVERLQPEPKLPAEIEQIVRQVSDYDTQYTLQVEETDPNSPLF